MKQRKEIYEETVTYLDYAVAQDDRQTALAVVDNYRQNILALRLLHNYYSSLPEAEEEPVCKISLLARRRGVYLFVLAASSSAYLYVLSGSEVYYVCQYRAEVPDELLSFFGYSNGDDFAKACPEVEKLTVFSAEDPVDSVFCQVCGVAEGEVHQFGCLVEICPWCEGTLNSCNCRFEQLEVDALETEEQLEAFRELLEAKGRRPFQGEDNPAYPGTSEGLDRDS
ncbi:MAG: hypothetical protein CSB32_01260 [Desulfobacterales bacterium]|nr:MAG: hypothetical protein CSB32_01260 [Desulfobacterales bacterium]